MDIRYRISHATHPNGDAETRLKPRDFLPFLFGFAPDGVCRATPVARSAVRSYRTLSPLPVLYRRSALCGTFPEVSFAGYYPAPCLRGARTFLSLLILSTQGATIRPSGYNFVTPNAPWVKRNLKVSGLVFILESIYNRDAISVNLTINFFRTVMLLDCGDYIDELRPWIITDLIQGF